MASVACNRVTVKIGDRTFTGHYSISDGTVTVSCGDEQETAKMGKLPPELKARMLLRELAIKTTTRECSGPSDPEQDAEIRDPLAEPQT